MPEKFSSLVFSTKQAALALGLSASTLIRDRRYGGLGIPFVRIGGRTVYPILWLVEWLKARLQVTRPREPVADSGAAACQVKKKRGRPRKLDLSLAARMTRPMIGGEST